jgi:hypothetical protein
MIAMLPVVNLCLVCFCEEESGRVKGGGMMQKLSAQRCAQTDNLLLITITSWVSSTRHTNTHRNRKEHPLEVYHPTSSAIPAVAASITHYRAGASRTTRNSAE